METVKGVAPVSIPIHMFVVVYRNAAIFYFLISFYLFVAYSGVNLDRNSESKIQSDTSV